MLVSFSSMVNAQAIFTNPITGTNPNTTDPYTTGQTVDANISVSGIGRGTGITGINANNRYNANGWNTATLDVNDYFYFTLTPNSGYKINFTSFVYSGQTSNTGPVNFAFRSSIDNFSSDIGTPTSTGATIDLTNSAYQNISTAIEFRLYGWGASGATGTFSVNDFTFNGNVSNVTISSFLPTSACYGSGASVVITGNNFTGATAVNFNGVSASFTVDNATQITATVPLTATTGTISVTAPGGTATSSTSFTLNAPTPTFTSSPGASTPLNTNVTYTTQSGQSNYTWNLSTGYTIISGGIGTASNTVTLRWTTTGNKTVSVNYSDGTCTGATPATNTTTVTSNVRYSVATGNWNSTATWSATSGGASGATVPGAGFLVFIEGNRTVTVNANTAALTAINIASGSTLSVSANFTVSATTLTVDGTYINNSTGAITFTTMTVGATGTYQHNINAGTIPTANWDATSNCNVTGVTSTIPGGQAQTFGNFLYNCPGETGNENFGPTSIAGNLEIISTNASQLRMTTTFSVGGNLIISGGTLVVDNNVGRSLTVAGNVLISGGTLDMNRGAGNGILYSAGNFTISGGTLTRSGSGSGSVIFNKSGIQTYSKTAGTISNVINFTVNPGSTLDVGTSIIDGSTGTFTLSPGAGIVTANTGGLSTSGATGSIQVTGRTYDNAADYTYNGATAQVTGNGLSGANNLTINNSAGVTLSSPVTVSGVANLTNGKLTTTGTNILNLTNTAASAVVGYSSANYISGPLNRSLANGSSYVFPVGTDTTYYPFGLNSVSGTSPVMTVQAFAASTGGSAGSGLCAISGTEYWQLTYGSGTFTDANVSLSRVAALSTLDAIGKSTTLAGAYTNLNGIVSSPSINTSDNIGSLAAGSDYFVMASKVPTANAGSALSAICQGGTSAPLGGSVGGSATGGTWTDGGIGGTFAPNATTLNATWTPPLAYSGLATLTLTTSGGACTAATANKTQQVNALPTPTFTVQPGASVCAITDVTYTTQAGQTNYIWVVPGVLNTDYSISTGGVGTSNSTVTLKWLTTGSKTVTINYTNASGCTASTATSSTATTVNALPTPTFTAQAGASACIGVDVTYTTQTGQTNYIWTVPGVLNADYSITSGGVGTSNSTVTLKWLTTGSKTVTINYTNASNCSAIAPTSSAATIVNALPTPTFTAQAGASACIGIDVTYTTQTGQSNYIWTVPGVLDTDYSITSGGIGLTNSTVTLKWLTTGSKTVTINYTNASGCTAVSATSSTATTVNTIPVITGTLNVCAGSTTQLTGSGTPAVSIPWVSASTGVATVNSSGLVTGVSAGTSVITYTNTNGCSITATVTVDALPAITGTLDFCLGSTTQLTGSGIPSVSTPWVSASTGVATVNSSGLVTGVSAGTSVITYTNSIGCSITATVTVSDIPAAPTGTAAQSFCSGTSPTVANLAAVGTTIQWYAAVSGGSPLAGSTALVDATHYYASQTVTGCESTSRFDVTVTLNTVLSAPTGTAAQSFCSSPAPTVADLTASGTSILWYAASTGGSALATSTPLVDATHYYASQTVGGCESPSRFDVTVTINTTPLAPTGTAAQSFCSGVSPTVADLAATGTAILWYAAASGGSALPTSTALVNGSHYYASQTVGVCESTSRFDVTATVNTSPTVSITGSTSICVGGTSTLSPTTSGTWISNNSAVATVTNAGVVTGVAAGTATFTYTITATGCSNTTSAITVNALPTVSITGSASICVGSTTTLSPATGGTWTSSNNAFATVTNGGIVTGVAAGSPTFTFTETSTGCTGTTSAVTVIDSPVVSITGSSSICVGSTTTLSPTTGGTWVSNSPGVASVSNAGLVTGIAAGTATFTYTLTSTGCSNTTSMVTSYVLPVAAGAITGSSVVSEGQANVPYSVGAITGATSYGWAYSGTGATINGTGNAVTISFSGTATSGNLTVYGINVCGNGTVSANFPITVSAPTGSIAVNRQAPENTYTPAQLVQNVLATGCLTSSNVTFAGAATQIGYFTNGTSSFPIPEGIILSTGKVFEAEGPNTDYNTTTKYAGAGDTQLDAAAGITSFDAAVLEFDFVPAGNTLEFNYVFASEEYAEFIGQGYNDAFAFFLSGPGIGDGSQAQAVNIALIPNTSTPVAINNIHGQSATLVGGYPAGMQALMTYPQTLGHSFTGGTNGPWIVSPTAGGVAPLNSSYYVDNGHFANRVNGALTWANGNGGTETEFDGRTTLMTASHAVTACSTYHIKIVVADAGDDEWDSGVFLQGHSFTTNEVQIQNLLQGLSGDNGDMYEGCAGSYIRFSRAAGASTADPLTFNVLLSGTATNGVDYIYTDAGGAIIGDGTFPNTATIPAGQTYADYYYKAQSDGVIEGNETILFRVINSCPCAPVTYFEKTVNIIDVPQIVTSTTKVIQCQAAGNPVATITVNMQNGLNPGDYEFSLDGGTFQASNVFTITATQADGSDIVGTSHSVTVRDKFSCNNVTENNIIIPAIAPFLADAGLDLSMCEGETGIQLNGSGGMYYSWSGSGIAYLSSATIANPTVSPAIPNGTYTFTLTAQDQPGASPACQGTDNMVLTVNQRPGVTATANTYSVCNAAPVQLNAAVTNGGASPTYLWSPSTNLSSATIANPVFTPNVSSYVAQSFTVTVTGTDGCPTTASTSNVEVFPA
ncbi:MAG: choice-of-anchor L domain-containing protein, partial [Bacteroidota bacterium]|nr:choice-of-anchor L domain-containing protein [Bacteroidota bacterium]